MSFPVILDFKRRPAVVAGDSFAALRRVRQIAAAGGRVILCWHGPDTLDLAELRQQVAFERVSPALLDTVLAQAGALFVMLGEGGERLAQQARRLGVPVTVADQPDLSTFQMPATIRRGSLAIAFATEGKAPGLASKLRSRIDAALPQRVGALVDFLGAARTRVRKAIPDAETRRRFWRRMPDGAVAQLVLAGREGEAQIELGRALGAVANDQPPIGWVALVGAGPGDPDLLTTRAVRLLSQADVVVHDDLVPAEILDLVPIEVERIGAGKRYGRHGVEQEDINDLIVRLAREGRNVVRLKSGDPFVFARGGEELEVLRAAGVPVQVVPGITAALGAAASAEFPLTHRAHHSAVTLATAHRASAEEVADWAHGLKAGHTLFLYMGSTKAAAIRDGLLAAGVSSATPVGVIESASRAGERQSYGTLADLSWLVEQHDRRNPILLAFGDAVALARQYGAQNLGFVAA